MQFVLGKLIIQYFRQEMIRLLGFGMNISKVKKINCIIVNKL